MSSEGKREREDGSGRCRGGSDEEEGHDGTGFLFGQSSTRRWMKSMTLYVSHS